MKEGVASSRRPWHGRSMRKLIASLLMVFLAAAPALAVDPPLVGPAITPGAQGQGTEASTAIAASYGNILYTPAKLVVAFVGMIGGAIAGVATGGDTRAAYAIWVPMVGGDYFLRPEVLDGTRPLAFFGSDYADRPSTMSSENDGSYAYEALYN